MMQALLNGVVSGLLIALPAIALSLTYGILNFANFSIGEAKWALFFFTIAARFKEVMSQEPEDRDKAQAIKRFTQFKLLFGLTQHMPEPARSLYDAFMTILKIAGCSGPVSSPSMSMFHGFSGFFGARGSR